MAENIIKANKDLQAALEAEELETDVCCACLLSVIEISAPRADMDLLPAIPRGNMPR